MPVTFRINPGLVNFQELVKLFRDPDFIQKYAVKGSELNNKEVADIKMGQADHYYGDTLKHVSIDYTQLRMDCKQFYPQELVYEMMIPGNLLKKIDELKAIHKIIDLAKDSGLITRQEIVSMMPPVLCDIKSHHSVLDMCAAPGSKTA